MSVISLLHLSYKITEHSCYITFYYRGIYISKLIIICLRQSLEIEKTAWSECTLNSSCSLSKICWGYWGIRLYWKMWKSDKVIMLQNYIITSSFWRFWSFHSGVAAVNQNYNETMIPLFCQLWTRSNNFVIYHQQTRFFIKKIYVRKWDSKALKPLENVKKSPALNAWAPVLIMLIFPSAPEKLQNWVNFCVFLKIHFRYSVVTAL